MALRALEVKCINIPACLTYCSGQHTVRLLFPKQLSCRDMECSFLAPSSKTQSARIHVSLVSVDSCCRPKMIDETRYDF